MSEAQVLEQEAGPDNTETTSEVSSWYSEENKDVVEKRGWKSADDAIKSYREIEKMASGKVKLPEDDAAWEKVLESDEERAKLEKRLGIVKPQSLDEYTVNIDSSFDRLRDGTAEEHLKKIAFESGVSPDAFGNMVSAYYASVAERMQKSYEEGLQKLHEELGDKFDEQVRVAQRFSQNLSPEFQELLEVTGLGNNPVVVKEFMGLAKKTMSDSLIKGELSSPEDRNWKPSFPDSPEMYATGEDEESKRARAYFEKRGHKY